SLWRFGAALPQHDVCEITHNALQNDTPVAGRDLRIRCNQESFFYMPRLRASRNGVHMPGIVAYSASEPHPCSRDTTLFEETVRMSTIEADYLSRYADSRAMFERAKGVIAGGITHDGRHISPFPPYIARADGARKWSVEGHELIDYGIGHGSLLFGHNDPDLTAAMEQQVSKGTHFSAGHEAEIRWAEKIVELVPSAERVRFTASGTESTLLAMRLARGYTQKNTILKFEGHFHGWQDYAL